MLTLFLSLLFVAVSVGGLYAIMSRLEKEHQRAMEGHTFGVIPFPEETTTPEKLSPRQLEQWWINNWLDKWFRLVGSKYEPREGDADYVAPKVEYIDVTKNENHNFQNPKMLTNGNTGWQIDQFGKVLSRDEIIGKHMPEYQLATSAQVNENFNKVYNLIENKPRPVYTAEQRAEHEDRIRLDPTHRMSDEEWSRFYQKLSLYRKRTAPLMYLKEKEKEALRQREEIERYQRTNEELKRLISLRLEYE